MLDNVTTLATLVLQALQLVLLPSRLFQRINVLVAVLDGTCKKLTLVTVKSDTADVRLHIDLILIYIACTLKYGNGALECDSIFVTKCRAILTNPRTFGTYDAATPEAGTSTSTDDDETVYCGDEVTEYSYGGCHSSCKSCLETYSRNGFTVGPAYNSAAAPADYSYGNAKYCYECHDGYYQVPAHGWDVDASNYDSTDLIAGYCKSTLILYAPTNLPSLRS